VVASEQEFILASCCGSPMSTRRVLPPGEPRWICAARRIKVGKRRDRQTDGRRTDALRLPVDKASVKINIYDGAVAVIIIAIAVHLMNADSAPGGRGPSNHANRLGLWVCLYRMLPSTSTIAVYYHYPVRKLIRSLSRPTTNGGRPRWPRHRTSPRAVLAGVQNYTREHIKCEPILRHAAKTTASRRRGI